MLLTELLAASERVAATRSRLAKIDALAECLRRLDVSEIALGVAYLSGDTRQGKIGIGYASLKDALAAAPASAPRLTLAQVDEAFARPTSGEQDFLARLILGELRQGALEGIMLDAIAKAANLPAARVRAAAMRAGGLPAVAEAALTEGETSLARFALAVFQPVQPMLAQPAEDVADALERLGTAAFEWKLDGARVQAHKSGGEIRVYTRSLNDVTSAVPEVVEALRDCAARELIAERLDDLGHGGGDVVKAAGDAPLERLFLRLPARRRDRPHPEARAGAFRRAREISPGEDSHPAPCHRRQGSRPNFLRRSARARPRRRDGEGARCALRSREPRRRLAQD